MTKERYAPSCRCVAWLSRLQNVYCNHALRAHMPQLRYLMHSDNKAIDTNSRILSTRQDKAAALRIFG